MRRSVAPQKVMANKPKQSGCLRRFDLALQELFKSRRKSFTLIEVVIAMLLMGMLLTFSFQVLKNIALTQNKLALDKEKILERAYFNERFSLVFSHLTPEDKFKATEIAGHKGLLFSYDEGLDSDPAYNGDVFGFLYQDKDYLIFQTWPRKEFDKGQRRKEFFFKNGSDFSWQLYDPESRSWIEHWDKKKLPALIKIKIKQEKELVEYGFIVPNNRLEITLPKGVTP